MDGHEPVDLVHGGAWANEQGRKFIYIAIHDICFPHQNFPKKWMTPPQLASSKVFQMHLMPLV